MKIRKQTESGSAEGDMTPMIDMTFQLIAFFMVLINFSEADQDQRIQLPKSELAKPPDGPLESPIYVHLQSDGNAIFNGEVMAMDAISNYLLREREVLALNNKTAAEATVIVRADGRAATGKVQELIQICQEQGYEKFALRAEEETGY